MGFVDESGSRRQKRMWAPALFPIKPTGCDTAWWWQAIRICKTSQLPPHPTPSRTSRKCGLGGGDRDAARALLVRDAPRLLVQRHGADVQLLRAGGEGGAAARLRHLWAGTNDNHSNCAPHFTCALWLCKADRAPSRTWISSLVPVVSISSFRTKNVIKKNIYPPKFQ